MKRIFEGFDQFWPILESASHATASLLPCQRTFVLHQNAGRPNMLYADGQCPVANPLVNCQAISYTDL
jgi:prepilin-type processing-associated H-X9-DG protein